MNCQEFYKLRDQRTVEAVGKPVPASIPIHVAIAPLEADSATGQHLLLSLANMLARVHREITFNIPPDIPLQTISVYGGKTLTEVILTTTRLIDPCGSFKISAVKPEKALSIAIGAMADGYDWYLGANRSIATLKKEPVFLDKDHTGTLRGAGLAACLGSAAMFKGVYGLPVKERTVSAWNYRENEKADLGPSNLDPIDVGRVLMLGAGAVGSALAYWLATWGMDCPWTTVDGDRIKVHNTNRSLLFVPENAGWPDSVPQKKVEVISRFLPGMNAVPEWHDEAPQAMEDQYDVILALANERSVRHVLANRNSTVTLHATTGNWFSQLHRHVAGHDDCLACRIDEKVEPQFECSKGEVEVAEKDDETSSDASLPFLSATSGLILATLLQRLQQGILLDDSRNYWTICFNSEASMTSGGHHSCTGGCGVWHEPALRNKLNQGYRWAHLDKDYIE